MTPYKNHLQEKISSSFQEVQLWLVPIWVLQNSLFIFMNILVWNVMETKLSWKQTNVFHYCQRVYSLEGMKSKNYNIRALCEQRGWNMNLLYVFAPFMCTTLLFFFWSINAKKKVVWNQNNFCKLSFGPLPIHVYCFFTMWVLPQMPMFVL